MSAQYDVSMPRRVTVACHRQRSSVPRPDADARDTGTVTRHDTEWK